MADLGVAKLSVEMSFVGTNDVAPSRSDYLDNLLT